MVSLIDDLGSIKRASLISASVWISDFITYARMVVSTESVSRRLVTREPAAFSKIYLPDFFSIMGRVGHPIKWLAYPTVV